MRLIIVRHGETFENANAIMMGGGWHGKLTKKGIMQARNARLEIMREKIDVAYSSDLGRCKQTAFEIIKGRDIPLHYTKELRERHAGIFTGKKMSEMNFDMKASGLSKVRYKPLHGESYLDMQKRVNAFVRKLYKKHKKDTVLFVTHSGVTKCLYSFYLKVPLEETMKKRTKNGGVFIVEISPKEVRQVKENIFK